MVTVANMPSGPCNRRPTSPEPGNCDQPSGTATVTVGAAGSDTCATADTAGSTGSGQPTVAAGTGLRVVVTMPGAAGPAASGGVAGFFGRWAGGVAALSPRAATPASVRTQAETSWVTNVSRTAVAQPNRFTVTSSVLGERLRQFPFEVQVRRARDVDDDLGDRSAGERVRSLVAARDRLPGVAPDGDAASREAKAGRVRAYT